MPGERLRIIAWGETDIIPLLWQAKLLSVSRSRLSYKPCLALEQKIRVKHRLNERYTQRPCLGSRKLAYLLAAGGIIVGRRTVRRYRLEMGLATLYPKPNLSQPSSIGHQIYPYLLRGLAIEWPDQVWGVDIIYIRLRAAFCTWWCSWTGSRGGSLPRNCPRHWSCHLFYPVPKQPPGKRFLRSLIVTRAATLRSSGTQAASLRQAHWFRRMGAVAMWTKSLQSVFGGQ